MTPEKVKLSDFLIEAPDKFVLLMNFIYGTDWLSYIRWRDGDHVADIISERLNIYYESMGGNKMNPEVELIKESDPEKIAAWDRLHDKRKTYRCHRCGAEWKCEYGANKFGTSHEHNGDPDILCQCCGLPTVKEVEVILEPLCENCKLFYADPKCRYSQRPDQYADECHSYKQIDAD